MRRSLALVLAVALAGAARAEDLSQPESRSFTIHPAKPPTPALSIRLIPPPETRIAGDAAVFYHRALESLIEIRYREEIQAMKGGGGSNVEQQAQEWLSGDPGRLSRDEVRTLVERRSRALEEARLGTLRETCDWGFSRREEGFSLLLSDIQEMRSLARWISLKARLDAEDGKIDDAILGARTGLAVARDVGRGGGYIQSLVAMTCANLTLAGLEDLIQKPGCPNLYWALATIPRPFIDLSDASSLDSAMVEQEFPLLHQIEGHVWSLDTARACGDQFARKLAVSDHWPTAASPLSRPSIDDLPAHAFQLLTVAKDYRRAKQALRDSGEPAERVEAMPMLQVVALDSYRTYQARRDDVLKWTYLPVWSAASGWDRAEQEYSKPVPGYPFVKLISAVRAVHASLIRLDRRMAVLMVAEALRLYAAAHDGALPDRLEDLVDAPAPHDPVTGRPFDYKREGDRAVLLSPAPAGSEHILGLSLRYEFRLAK